MLQKMLFRAVKGALLLRACWCVVMPFVFNVSPFLF